MHVLSTPPAFVLSQDQTLVFNPSNLRSLVSLRFPETTASQVKTHFRINCRFYLNLSVSFSRFSRSQGFRLSPSAPRLRSLAGPFPERLDIIPRPPPDCQQLFSIFFSFFQTCFKSRTFALIPSVFCVSSDGVDTTGQWNVRFCIERVFSLPLYSFSHFALFNRL